MHGGHFVTTIVAFDQGEEIPPYRYSVVRSWEWGSRLEPSGRWVWFKRSLDLPEGFAEAVELKSMRTLID